LTGWGEKKALKTKRALNASRKKENRDTAMFFSEKILRSSTKTRRNVKPRK
jgi:hypothetical protein